MELATRELIDRCVKNTGAIVHLTEQEWRDIGRELFGDNEMKWRFQCPSCGYVVTPDDYKCAGAPETAVAFSCIGRWIGSKREAFGGPGNGPCNYAGGGLFRLNPVHVGKHQVFEQARDAAVWRLDGDVNGVIRGDPEPTRTIT